VAAELRLVLAPTGTRAPLTCHVHLHPLDVPQLLLGRDDERCPRQRWCDESAEAVVAAAKFGRDDLPPTGSREDLRSEGPNEEDGRERESRRRHAPEDQATGAPAGE